MSASELYLDIGNTNIKWQGDDCDIEICARENFNIALLPKSKIIWAAASGDANIIENVAGVRFAKTQKRYKNLINGYQNYEALGIDRWLAMVAAIEIYPEYELLIIDIGTIITMDRITKNGKHQGGLLMPGILPLRRSFAKFQSDENSLSSVPIFAKNTEDGWLSGTREMLIGAVERQIQNFNPSEKSLTIITGGGGEKIIPLIKNKVRFHPHLVLRGLRYYAETVR